MTRLSDTLIGISEDSLLIYMMIISISIIISTSFPPKNPHNTNSPASHSHFWFWWIFFASRNLCERVLSAIVQLCKSWSVVVPIKSVTNSPRLAPLLQFRSRRKFFARISCRGPRSSPGRRNAFRWSKFFIVVSTPRFATKRKKERESCCCARMMGIYCGVFRSYLFVIPEAVSYSNNCFLSYGSLEHR